MILEEGGSSEQRIAHATMDRMLSGEELDRAAADSYKFANCANIVAMALTDDYLDTKRALVAMTRAFKKYIDFASKHDSYLIGQIDDEAWEKTLRDYAVSDCPDIAQLSRWMDIALRHSGVVAYADELAVMFDVSEEQAMVVLTGLEQRGILSRAKE